jgi:hypothetical protein
MVPLHPSQLGEYGILLRGLNEFLNLICLQLTTLKSPTNFYYYHICYHIC